MNHAFSSSLHPSTPLKPSSTLNHAHAFEEGAFTFTPPSTHQPCIHLHSTLPSHPPPSTLNPTIHPPCDVTRDPVTPSHTESHRVTQQEKCWRGASAAGIHSKPAISCSACFFLFCMIRAQNPDRAGYSNSKLDSF